MKNTLHLVMLTFVLLFEPGHAFAAEDRELYQQRLEAQRERQQQVDQQQYMKQIQELGADKRKINTEYRKIKDKNRIERREERKAILAE